MNNPYFREGQHYSFSNLKAKFGTENEAKTKHIIDILKRYYILKVVSKDKPEYEDLSDQDIISEEISADSSNYVYVFTFVGVILLDDVVIKCYPKYMDSNYDNDSENHKDKEDSFWERFKVVIKVIEKYNSKEQLVSLYNGDGEDKKFNKLTISLHILYDYFENGLYSNQHQVIETNGDGEILWDKTIDETFAYIQNNTPYYLELQTLADTQNDQDFIRRLHGAVVSQCSKDLENADLLDLFGISAAEPSDELIEDIGDVDYLKYKIEAELKNQFITKKQNLLKTLYTYISEKDSNESDCSFSLFGTTAFNLVWEKACGALFGNVYDKNIVLEKPQWIFGNDVVEYSGELIPDIITLRNNSLYIFDGKYYLLNIDRDKKKLTGNPGIQDVIKQYVYNAALQNYIDKNEIQGIANIFVMPFKDSEKTISSENEKAEREIGKGIKVWGTVPFWSVQRSGFTDLPVLQVLQIAPELVWKHYLSNSVLEDDIWEKITVSPTKNYLYNSADEKALFEPRDVKEQKSVLVGFLRQKYFDFVSDKKSFIFYFYATNENVRFPMHPYIDFCSEFIGFTEDKSKFVKGKLCPITNERCKIEEVQAEDLIVDLKANGFEKGSGSGVTYYKMTVTDVELVDKPYNGIPDYEALENMMKMEGLNQVLYRSSPKVIHI